jgi:hypothetical protein
MKKKRMKRNVEIITALIALVTFVCGCSLIKARRLTDKEETVSVVTYHLETMIDSPVEEVFELTRMWNTYVVDWAEYTTTSSHGLTGIGNYSTGKASLVGRSVVWNEVVTDWEDDRRVKFVYSGDIRGSVEISMEPAGDQTKYSFTTHAFFLPDSIGASALEALLEQGILGDYLNEIVTDFIVKDIATLEGKAPEDVLLTGEPGHEVFVDAYFTADETFDVPARELFGRLTSTRGLESILPVDRIEPVGGSPETFEQLGDHYRVTASEELMQPLEYDMVVVQYDPPKEVRFYLYAHDVCMEIDLLVIPTLTGSRVLTIFILNFPKSVEGRAFDVLMHTSNIDQAVQKRLTELKNNQVRQAGSR